ncbi:hypothetical protein Cgig2_033560 [Carnegiea gigantea]|uniref:Uncharacterized protein n=1 Tax=Carnegiea gigantea TaxID=171969 RepID=A0A9Q1KQG7_9CARY|nr:hypothetical protein Cgig2_033560 [Carnegiea gigantea]
MEKGSLTFIMKGPRFTNMKLLITTDPANAQHILTKNFGNYPKGSNFKDIFEILGDGIFNEKIETGLIPILDHVSKQGLEIELQDSFGRFIFDTISTVILEYDPRTLCFDLPNFSISKALHDGEEAIFYHHVVPACVWKFQKWLGKFKEVGDKLIYLHATICEALKLYPPVPFNAKVPIEPDKLPSGHKVDSSTQSIFSMYAMERMKSLWGEDCYEFKPERWILEIGKIRHALTQVLGL